MNKKKRISKKHRALCTVLALITKNSIVVEKIVNAVRKTWSAMTAEELSVFFLCTYFHNLLNVMQKE